ncbi:YhhA family cyclophane-containing RiPP [Lysinibacillus capsici]|uniref:YhhA family cyclophane-containing RiPP n=1 Tax=Lysinibacillus capsici TaxID=2115968 RepID=UPI00272F39F5|nr:YhhA family cyclophane-containing RiPP [Lysinibacillus capsici]MDP1394453.1 YhhA family cyclophane-containing RiPP [Lysinibacillus capsici]MDP1414877.1 YhhA family cyclophane-containing RiPP [Lysinibacillus capsici]MDP1430771.1 YhhA family cyclophane-containing RiPP [Lysinibacillus capsici]
MGLEALKNQLTSAVKSTELETKQNAALNRLGSAVEKRGDIINITNYSRMHNRHNRS